MVTVKLTKSQLDVLQQAKHVCESNQSMRRLHERLFVGDPGWFLPERHEEAIVYGYTQTCAALCGMGLLEYKLYDSFKVGGKWRLKNCYRITPAGLEALDYEIIA